MAPPEISTTPTPEPTPTRPPVITGKLDTGKLFNGITLHSTVETLSGADAATERTQPESYLLDLKLQARVPSPNKTIEELAKVSPQLPTLLPGLASMFSADPVSPLYAQLYDSTFSILRRIEKRSCSRQTWMWMLTAPMRIGCPLAPAHRLTSSRPQVIAGQRKRPRLIHIWLRPNQH